MVIAMTGSDSLSAEINIVRLDVVYLRSVCIRVVVVLVSHQNFFQTLASNSEDSLVFTGIAILLEWHNRNRGRSG